jgi:very-short-patch-repair endonuclease
VHHTKNIERVVHRELPVTPVAQTLVDFASLAPLDQVRRAVAKADFQRRLDLDSLGAVVGVGRAGSARLKRALTLHCPQYARTLSALEDCFLDLCRRHRLPLPEVNLSVCGFTVDALWRAERVIVELDGDAAHGTSAQTARDHQRDLALRAAGFSVLRYSWWQVTKSPAAVAADVRRTLKMRGHRASRRG